MIQRARNVAYVTAWRAENRRALARRGPLWVVLGDSTAQGIGASRRSHSYVLPTLDRLRQQRDLNWRVVNLSRSGATARDVVQLQLPALRLLPPPSLVSCTVGINDLIRTGSEQMVQDFNLLAAVLPWGALLANIPYGHDPNRSRWLNNHVGRLVAEHGLILADLWTFTQGRGRATLAADAIHPSDIGYRAWSEAFGDALGLEYEP